MKIFISYRRDDSIISAKLVRDELVAHFGADSVFMDIDDIGYGADFVQTIDTNLESADVLLVVIGPRWVEILETRQRGDDWVRHEISRALQLSAKSTKNKLGRPHVLPLLVGGVPPPSVTLPADIASLQHLSMLALDERALNASLNTLIEAIKQKSFKDEADELKVEMQGRRRAQIAGAVIGVGMFLACWIALFDFLTLDTRLDSATMILASVGRTGTPAPWSGEVVLVGIDERTLAALGRKEFDSSWRAEHAQIIKRAAAAGARTVAFDIFLADKGIDEKANVALETALIATRAAMPVVFAVEEMNGHSPAMLPRFEKLTHWGIACGGKTLGQARSMLLAVQREAIPPAPESAPREKRFIVHSSLALAAFSGGGKAGLFDEAVHTVPVLLTREAEQKQVAFYAAETVASMQPGCGAVTQRDRTMYQLFDPLALPALREPPQRLAYERVLAGDAAALSQLKDKIVLVGAQLAKVDVQSTGAGGERWGVDLIAQQIDAMTRNATIRQLGWPWQWLLTSGFGLVGAIAAFRMRQRPAVLRRVVIVTLAVLSVAASVLWYRMQQQFIGLPYNLGALLLGAWVANHLIRRQPT